MAGDEVQGKLAFGYFLWLLPSSCLRVTDVKRINQNGSTK
jgi:hypothetical protein